MKIAAVIVTYNRLNELKKCIKSIRNQTRPVDKIIVVNNGSTDGTQDWLIQQKDLYVISQENLGSGGGQYTGIKAAYEMGYDWIWTMDDDGRAELKTLDKLIKHANEKNKVLHPLVISPVDKNIFSFGCWILKNGKPYLYKTVEDFKKDYPRDKVLPSLGTPFNGTLISREVVKKCGLPRPELFIWGDETEYINRIHKAGVLSVVITDAFFYHPHNPLIYNILNSEIKDWWKIYYLLRNRILIFKMYNKSPISELKFIKTQLNAMLYVLRKNPKDFPFKFKIIVLASIHGLFNKFGPKDIK